jgi:hypothetical protein
MKNRLIDLNNHLFAQLERLSEEDISEIKLQQEIERTKAITLMAREIIGNGKLILDGQRAVQGDGLLETLPDILQLEHKG